MATGPDAALGAEVELRPDPPVRHTAAVLGPGGVDLLWLSTGDPAEMTVWTPRRTTGQPRLFEPVPGAPDFVVPITLDSWSTAVLTLETGTRTTGETIPISGRSQHYSLRIPHHGDEWDKIVW